MDASLVAQSHCSKIDWNNRTLANTRRIRKKEFTCTHEDRIITVHKK